MLMAEGFMSKLVRGFRPQPIASTVHPVGFYTPWAEVILNRVYYLLPY